MNTPHGTSQALLDAARSRLRAAGFAVEVGSLNGTPWILAENDWFAVGVIAPKDLREADAIEPWASGELMGRLGSPEAGAKRWDGYLAVLLQDTIDFRDGPARALLDEIQYNTRGVRRIVAPGVRTDQDVEVALRPLLPLPAAAENGLPEPYTDLVAELKVNGIDDEQAERSVAVFQQSGTLDDV